MWYFYLVQKQNIDFSTKHPALLEGHPILLDHVLSQNNLIENLFYILSRPAYHLPYK